MIEKKVCSKCGEEKSISEYYKDASKPSGYRKECKTCRRSYDRAYARGYRRARKKLNTSRYEREKQETGGFAVYYLPEEHYVGMTNNLHRRMGKHRRSGKCVEGMEIVGVYQNPIEAHLVETRLHFMGYLGFASGNLK